ncbi:unnamed protein product, partial [Rotaria magnacalcarata]
MRCSACAKLVTRTLAQLRVLYAQTLAPSTMEDAIQTLFAPMTSQPMR